MSSRWMRDVGAQLRPLPAQARMRWHGIVVGIVVGIMAPSAPHALDGLTPLRREMEGGAAGGSPVVGAAEPGSWRAGREGAGLRR